MSSVFESGVLGACCALLAAAGCGDVPEADAAASLSQIDVADFAGDASATAPRDGSAHAGSHPMDAGVKGGAPSHAAHADAAHVDEGLCPPGFPTFREGLTASAGDLTVRLLTVDPRPPRQLVDNDWTVELASAVTGLPRADVDIVDADSWMSVHEHGGRFQPTVERRAEPGGFVLRGLDFKMRGPWLVRFYVQQRGAARPVRLSLPICVE